MAAVMTSGLGWAETVKAAPASISELVELLISIGVISQDKAPAARSAFISSSVPNTTLPSFLQLIEPKSAQTWSADSRSSHLVKWGSTSVPEVKVSLIASSTKATKTASSTPAVLCDLYPGYITSRDGDNQVNISDPVKCYGANGAGTILANGTYKLKITGKDAKGKSVSVEGPAIKLISPTLSMTYPNGGEVLKLNDTHPLKYTLTNAVARKMSLFLVNSLSEATPLEIKDTKIAKTATSSKTTKATTTITSANNFKFDPATKAGPYKLKMNVLTKNGTMVEDISNGFFWISDTR